MTAPRSRTVPLAICLAVAVAALALVLAPGAGAMGDHDHVAPTPPAAGDARFLPGTVGPVVFRGTAATVTIPDGPGFGGEKGRRQNAGDLRKNNYSVTDANFNNVLGLLPRDPDTGTELTYVQHIQLYAAAGYVEAFAPEVYAHMIMHQNRGEGTVLGAAGYLMGLVRTADPAAHGLSAEQIPATLPGTTIDARNYVRATRDATGQEWARPHHAQTAPMVFAMLVAAGLTPSTALILASDDGISGAGRLNGMNEQDGSKDGFNNGERATWAFAAQLQAQTGIPVVLHLMHGHDHAGIDASALTRPKANALIGLAADDRSASDARAAALQAALVDGRIATAQTAANDQNLTVRNEAYLRPRSALRVGVDAPFDGHQDAGARRAITVTVKNDGPHVAREVALSLATSANLRVLAIDAPAGAHCTAEQRTCHFGDISAETDRERKLTVQVEFTAAGRSGFEARLTSSSPVETRDLVARREHDVHGATTATLSVAARPFGLAVAACGAALARACVVKRAFGTSFVATARPGAAGDDRRWVKLQLQQRVGKVWRSRGDVSARVDAQGRVRIRAKGDRFAGRGPAVWRARLVAGEHRLYRGATSGWRYLAVR